MKDKYPKDAVDYEYNHNPLNTEDIQVGKEYFVAIYGTDAFFDIGYNYAAMVVTDIKNQIVYARLVKPFNTDEDSEFVTELEFNIDPDSDSEQGMNCGWYGENYNFYNFY